MNSHTLLLAISLIWTAALAGALVFVLVAQ